MIVHIFTANRYHLVPTISKGFASKYSDFEHRFILFGTKELDESKYTELYESLNFKNYEFCYTLSEFYLIMKKYMRETILFHAGNYSWFIIAYLAGSKNVNWICWGAGASIGGSLKSKLFTPIKKILYKKFNSIVTLMEADKDTIIKDFNVAPDKITTISYSSGNPNKYYEFYKQLIYDNNKRTKSNTYKPLVLLGNNPGNINGYISLIKDLSHFAGKIRVQCMLHYSLIKNEKYYELIKLGKDVFGSDFRSNEEFYEDRVDYINYMNTCDIYMCDSEKQTGLGAIYTTVSLGKKVYITGKNLSWIQSLGALVFEVKEIGPKYGLGNLIEPLSIDKQIENLYSIQKMREKGTNNWNRYLAVIANK